MPLGNPTQSSAPGAMPWMPTRSYGGGAGKVYTNPWGAKTTVAKGGAAPVGPGQNGFGQDPFTGFSPRSKKESDAYIDPRNASGKVLQQRIQAYREQLMNSQKG
jgi:hypothetical protein